ncbi:MAG: hypothetical protein NTX98_02665 [Candidatus Doudnabacteria bacterium]|nr:hypothetical protein [Candidatus Doudnabacteria bacterium]
MKKTIVILGLALLSAGCGSTANKPAPTAQSQPAKEGQACSAAQTCETGLKCANNVCSSGKTGSACSTYKDCSTGLFCVKSVCSNPPSYTKYFSKITISKMKQGMPPGPNNMPVPTTEFKTTDALEIDLIAKAGISGTIHYDLINSTTGFTEMSSADNKQKVRSGGFGTGFGIPGGLVGDFELNVYYNDELVYTVPITISQ